MIKTLKDLILLLDAQQKRQLFKLQILIIIMAILELVAIASIGPFMAIVANPEIISQKDYFQYVAERLDSSNKLEVLGFFGLAVLCLLTVSSLFSLFVTKRLLVFGAELGASLSSRLFRYYMGQDWLFHSHKNSSELTAKISAETYRTTQGIIQPLLMATSKAVLVIFISTSIFIFNPLVAIAGLSIFGGAYLIIFTIIKLKLAKNGRSISEISVIRFQAMAEGFGGIKDTLLSNLQEKFAKQFEENSNRLAICQSNNQVYALAPRYILELIAYGAVIGLVMYLIISEQGKLDQILPIISVYALAGFKLLPALQHIFFSLTQIKANTSAFENIKEDLNKSSAPFPSQSCSNLTFNQSLQLEDISFAYPGKSQQVLSNVNLTVQKNQSIGIVGSSGSGKSTLVDILLGLIEPQAGRISIDKEEITATNKQSWQKKIGYVPQHIFLSDQTIAENIAFGVDKEKISQPQLSRVIELASLDDFINSLDLGLNTSVGEKGLQLSGGQRQRIGIARALYHEPEVLVFDEATSALDGITESSIMAAINQLSGKKTIIMIAHRLSTIEHCNTIYMLEKGKVVDTGRYDELLKKNDEFKRMASNSR